MTGQGESSAVGPLPDDGVSPEPPAAEATRLQAGPWWRWVLAAVIVTACSLAGRAGLRFTGWAGEAGGWVWASLVYLPGAVLSAGVLRRMPAWRLVAAGLVLAAVAGGILTTSGRTVCRKISKA